jgi:hypothetical protein
MNFILENSLCYHMLKTIQHELSSISNFAIVDSKNDFFLEDYFNFSIKITKTTPLKVTVTGKRVFINGSKIICLMTKNDEELEYALNNQNFLQLKEAFICMLNDIHLLEDVSRNLLKENSLSI